VNDDGHVSWNNLTVREKAARTTQQSLNLFVIVVGVGVTGGIFFLLYHEVFSTDSRTRHFNRAVTRIKSSPACIELLGKPESMFAFGDSPWSSFARARIRGPSPTTRVAKDGQTGVETLSMTFLVRGEVDEGWVTMKLVKGPQDSAFEWELLALDVKGHQRVYLEGAPKLLGGLSSKSDGKVFGIKWR